MPPRRRAADATRRPQVFNTAASAFIFLAVDKDLRGRLERDWCAHTDSMTLGCSSRLHQGREARPKLGDPTRAQVRARRGARR